MRQSSLFTKVQKTFPKDEEAVNARWLVRAGFVNKLMAGAYSLLPLGLRVIDKIARIIREEMNAVGGQEILMPVLHPKENWDTTKRWSTVDVLFKVKGRDDKDFALGPTHEEIVVPLAKHFISSYRDLPTALYQIQTKFRDEARAKSGLLRGKEFSMKDMYSFHTDEKDFDKFYEKMKAAYQKVFTRLGLDAVLVEASGGTFSEFSHEFQVLHDAGEDTIFHCSCGFAQNKEIFKGEVKDSCPNCGKAIKASKGVEVGNIFPLASGFSDPFGLTYKNEAGEEKKVIMGCYGIGLGRALGMIVETHNDDAGMIWPIAVAPYHVHLLSLGAEKDASVKDMAEKTYEELQKAGIEILYDDREVMAGEKFAESDMIGLPIRLVVSTKTSEKIEVKERQSKEAKLFSLKETIEFIKKQIHA